MDSRIIIANWKMNGSAEMVANIVPAIVGFKAPGVRSVLCPPAIFLKSVAEMIGSAEVFLGGQNCSTEKSGAFTGEISPEMLGNVGCRYVIIGHSERRQCYFETNGVVGKKFVNAMEAGLIPICCVGETGEERSKGLTREVINGQIDSLFTALGESTSKVNLEFLIAYEPVWAIGTGESASPELASETHIMIRDRVAQHNAVVAETIKILYGGSVNEKNAGRFFEKDEICGALIGGASLKPHNFNAIRKLAAGD